MMGVRGSLFVLPVLILIIGCSHAPPSGVFAPPVAFPAEPAVGPPVSAARSDSVLSTLTVSSPLDTLAAEIPDIPDSTAKASRQKVQADGDAIVYDIPIELNRRVLTFVEKHSRDHDGWFSRALQRSGRVLPMINRIFEEEGLPKDLAFMALVESGYRYNARSRAGAIGMWQFIRGTGKRYGLLSNGYVDERLDPEKATRAAARYLKDLYARFGDWYLAMAAYNAGEGKVERAIRQANTRDFWELAQTRHLVRETQNYVPAILAAIVVSRTPEHFGLNVTPESPLEYETVSVKSVTHLDVIARCCGVPSGVIRSLNPALLAQQTPPGHHPYEVRVPVGTGEKLLAELERIPAEDRMLYARHRVRTGESLSILARRYGTSVGAIQQANRLGRRTLINAGQMLLVPTTEVPDDLAQDDTSSGSEKKVATRAGTGSRRGDSAGHRGSSVTHRVRRGETLADIARAYGTTTRALQAWNRLSNPNRIRTGQPLKVYGDVRRPSPAHETDERPARTSLGAAAAAAKNAPAAGLKVHSVRQGESLWSIAREFGVSVSELRKVNSSLRRSSVIRPGDRILVPGSGPARTKIVHRIANGDTLWEIADRYGVSLSELREWNGLSGAQSAIHVGQRLVIYR